MKELLYLQKQGLLSLGYVHPKGGSIYEVLGGQPFKKETVA